jgi:hypothetical protein
VSVARLRFQLEMPIALRHATVIGYLDPRLPAR